MWYLLVGAIVVCALALIVLVVLLHLRTRRERGILDQYKLERALAVLAASSASTLAVELRHIAQRREEHSAVQLVTLCASVIEAGDRASGGGSMEAAGYYAERSLELVIAAAEAVHRDKQVQAGQDPVPPPGAGEQNA